MLVERHISAYCSLRFANKQSLHSREQRIVLNYRRKIPFLRSCVSYTSWIWLPSHPFLNLLSFRFDRLSHFELKTKFINTGYMSLHYNKLIFFNNSAIFQKMPWNSEVLSFKKRYHYLIGNTIFKFKTVLKPKLIKF